MREKSIELWVIEETGKTIVDADGEIVDPVLRSILEQLKLNKVKATVYVVQENGVYIIGK